MSGSLVYKAVTWSGHSFLLNSAFFFCFTELREMALNHTILANQKIDMPSLLTWSKLSSVKLNNTSQLPCLLLSGSFSQIFSRYFLDHFKNRKCDNIRTSLQLLTFLTDVYLTVFANILSEKVKAKSGMSNVLLGFIFRTFY